MLYRFVGERLVGGGIVGRGCIAVFITRGLVFVLVFVILLVPTPREDGKDVEASSVLVTRSAGRAVLVARRSIVTDRGSITVAWLLVLVLILVLIFVTKSPSAGTVWSSIPRAGGAVAIAWSSITCAWCGIIVRGGWG